MAVSKETTNPSKIPLYIWFCEVIFVLVFCCVVIRMSVIPWPPTYALTNISIPGIQDGNSFSIQDREEIKLKNATIILSLLVTNMNNRKVIVYDETKISLYKNGSLVGGTTLPGLFQSGKSNVSSLVLVNVNQEKMKFGGRDKNGILKIGLETKVRYIILGWTTKRHLLDLEAFVTVDLSGKLSLGDEGIKLEAKKHKP